MRQYILQPHDVATLVLLNDALDSLKVKMVFDIPIELLEEIEALQGNLESLLNKLAVQPQIWKLKNA